MCLFQATSFARVLVALDSPHVCDPLRHLCNAKRSRNSIKSRNGVRDTCLLRERRTLQGLLRNASPAKNGTRLPHGLTTKSLCW
jgi:hypothetical protein